MMMKVFIRIAAMVLAVFPSSLIAQSPAVATAPSPAAAASKEIPVDAADANELLRIQRDIQAHQLQQQATEEQSKKDIQALIDKYTAALNAVRVKMKVRADAQFDGYKVAFVVPAPPTAAAAKPASKP